MPVKCLGFLGEGGTEGEDEKDGEEPGSVIHVHFPLAGEFN
jgi:hypothetical protein